MIYLKSFGAGLVGALLGAILMVMLGAVAFAGLAAFGRGVAATGSGGIGVVVMRPAVPVLVFAAAGFVAGFWWMYRRQSGV
jgi:hypothetical protein